ncbi:MAG: DUF5367 family protein [archaeon]
MVNLKRAVLIGALFWVLIFFEVSILMFGLGLESGTLYYIVHYILSVILVAIASLIYFRGKVKAGAKEGLLLGLIMALTGIILDLIITVPLFVKDYTAFFGDLYLWIGILLGIITVTLIGIKKFLSVTTP